MKSLIRKLLIPIAGLALSAAPAEAAWPPAPGDLILGVQATTGPTTNVFFNMGPAHVLRDNPNPGGTLVNLDAELVAAFGAGWAARTDLYFGVFANRSSNDPGGIDPAAPENGDAARTIYTSKGTSVAGTATPWMGFSVSALGIAGTAHQGQISALGAITANGNDVATLTQAANPVQWNNGWSEWNPTPGAAFQVFSGGIQAQLNATTALVDVFRIPSTTGTGTYVTTVSLAANGDVSAARAGGGNVSYFTVTATATNGNILGAGAVNYADGSSAKLTAQPNANFGFVGWSGDASGTANPLTLLMDSNKSVTANFAPLPTVTSPTATELTGTSATLGGNVTSNGGQTVTERGVVYSEQSVNGNPLIDGASVTKETTAGDTGVFSVPATGLVAGTTYAYKGFATTVAGTGYTSVAFFTTDTDVTLTGGVGSVTNRAIQPGDTQAFNFNLANGATSALTSSGAFGISWELRDGIGALVDSGTGPVNVNQVLLAGDYRLLITGGGAAETFSLNLDGSNAASSRPFVVAQTALLKSKKAKPVTGGFLISNVGTVADTFTVRGTPGNNLFSVSYFQGGNVTASVIAGTLSTGSLDPNTTVPLQVTVTPNKKKLIKKKKTASGKKKKKIKKKSIIAALTAVADSNASSASASVRVQTK